MGPTPARTPHPAVRVAWPVQTTRPHPSRLSDPARRSSPGPAPGRQALPGRKVSKLRGDRSSCRQAWTGTCPIGSILLHSSRPVAGGAANYGHFLSCEANVPQGPARSRIPHPAPRLNASRPCRVDKCPRLATDRHHPANAGRMRAHLGRLRSTRGDPQARRREVWDKSVPKPRPPRSSANHCGGAEPAHSVGAPFSTQLPPAMRAPRIPAYLSVVRSGRLPLHVSTKARPGLAACDLRNHPWDDRGLVHRPFSGHTSRHGTSLTMWMTVEPSPL
jgi:hypothetical protein